MGPVSTSHRVSASILATLLFWAAFRPLSARAQDSERSQRAYDAVVENVREQEHARRSESFSFDDPRIQRERSGGAAEREEEDDVLPQTPTT